MRITVPDAKITATEPTRRRSAAERLRRSIASPTSGALAYTVFCLVTLLFAVCVEKMPFIVLERVAQIRQLL